MEQQPAMITKFGLTLTPDAWSNFRCDFFAALFFSMFNVVFNQFYVPIAIQEGASNTQTGLLTAAPAIGLLFSPLWAAWIGRKSPNPFVIYPNLIARLLILIPAFFGAPWVFVVTAFAFQMLMGIQAPAYAALMPRIYPPAARGRLMGYVRVAMGALMIPIAYGVGAWIDADGPSGPLMLASVTGAASILMFLRLKESEPVQRQAGAKRATLREQWTLVKGNRALLFFFAATTFSGFGNILASPIYQLIQVNELDLSNNEIGFARACYFTFLFVTYFVVGWAVDRFSPRQVLIYGIAAFAVVPLLYGIFGNYPAVLAGSCVQGMGDAIWDIGILAFVFRIAPGREGVVFALHLMLFGIRGSIAPILSTTLSDLVPFAGLLFAASICGWIGTLLFAYGSKSRPGRQSDIPAQSV